MTRNEVIGQACDQCLKELYSYAQPKVTWEAFIEENKNYKIKEKTWEEYTSAFDNQELNPEQWEKMKSTFPDWENKSFKECVGPSPYDFYYISREITKDICDFYIYAYKLDNQQELLDTIETLKNYCKDPIISKYFEEKGKPGDLGWSPGYRGYDYPDNLEKEINKILLETTSLVTDTSNKVAEELQNKFFEFLDKAGEFYDWNRELNSFNMSIYLGASPSHDKKAVIENWKKYRGVDIEIDEEKMKKEYYGEDFDE